jgi:hypothetical protein
VSCEVGEVDRAALEALLADHGAMVSEETLAVSLRAESAGAHQLVKEDQLEGLAVRLGVSRAPSTR